MLTDGKYFEEYLKQLPIKESARKRNALLASIIKRLGNNKKFEKLILGLRRQLSIPAEGYARNLKDGDCLVNYNFSAEVEGAKDKVEKQYEKWRVPIDLRFIIGNFVLCNEPLYFDYRRAKGITELNDYSAVIKIRFPINSRTELNRYIDMIWPGIENHQLNKGYKKSRKRAFSKAENHNIVIDVHEKVKNMLKSERSYPSSINSEVADILKKEHGLDLSNDTINSILNR
jgi:hypothetical protein